MKQSKLRRRRVIRYAILYFVLLVVFVALIAGPLVAGKHLDLESYYNQLQFPLGKNKLVLMQPNFFNQDNTLPSSETGTGNPSYSYPTGYGPSSSTGGGSAATGN